jgi:hypothetical protein
MHSSILLRRVKVLCIDALLSHRCLDVHLFAHDLSVWLLIRECAVLKAALKLVIIWNAFKPSLTLDTIES